MAETLLSNLKYTLAIFIFVCLGPKSWAGANSNYVDGVQVKFANGADFAIGQMWSDSARTELIGGNVRGSDKVSRVLTDDLPLSSWVIYPVNNVSNFKKMGKMIADHCKMQYPTEVMPAISCSVNSVNATLAVSGWPSSSTFCRAHATAFRAAFEAMEIPRSNVFDVDSSTSAGDHVVSRFVLTANSGQTFSYVIDVGNKPNQLFPNTEITQNWYKKGLKHPKFSFTEQPQYQFAPASNSEGAR